MCFSYLIRRLLRKREWQKALSCGDESNGFWTLCRLNSQAIFQAYAAIAECTETIRENSRPEAIHPALERLHTCDQKLTLLLPFASAKQRKIITDAQKCAQYARSITPESKEPGRTEMRYYTVYIPTLDGQFYYLGSEEYRVGDIISIPFGAENKIIYGVVKEAFCEDYWKLPLPLWKMKYIGSLAPQPIAEEYRRQVEKAKQEQ